MPWRNWISWRKAPFYALAMMFCWPWLLQLFTFTHINERLIVFIVAIYANYFYFIFSIAKGQRLSDGVTPAHAVWLFVLSNIILAMVFAIGWHHFAVFGPPLHCLKAPTLLQAIYFSAEIFSTVGFGDLLPCSDQGQMLFIAESLIGTTHFGVFMTLIFSRVIFPQSKPKTPRKPKIEPTTELSHDHAVSQTDHPTTSNL